MIETWLESFHKAWRSHDINSVMNLFADDVEYWETPSILLKNKSDIEKEWQAVVEQQDIEVSWEIYSSVNNRHTVIWKLHYEKAGQTYESSGVYLITLDSGGLCKYFYYLGESS